MKRIVSVSLGSSKRDAACAAEFCGEKFSLLRVGTNGDKALALSLIGRYAGAADALGLGGTDLYIYAGGRRYAFRESMAFVKAARGAPIFDGSGLKNTLEKRAIHFLQDRGVVDFRRAPVLLVCGVDRFGMASALDELGADVIYGDLLFGLNLPVPVKGLARLGALARAVAPIVTKLPVSFFYPTGKAQETRKPKFTSYFHAAKIIAGDFHFIRRNMPDDMTGKIVITNTVTRADREMLKQNGAALLITTTPEFDGRSFGTNMMEAVLYALGAGLQDGRRDGGIEGMIDACGLSPCINYLNENRV